MPSSVLVSVIIPAFNEEKMLKGCLDSLSGLDWPGEALEVIVVDNGSCDRTCEVAQGMDATVLRDPNATVAGLRNLGAAHASGTILAFVDADCTVPGDWLTSASRYFEDETIAAWGAPPEIPQGATWVQQAWYLLRGKSGEAVSVDWLESMNLFVRKNLFEKTGGFDPELVTCEDVDLCYRLSDFGRIVADPSIRMVHLGEAATLRQFAKKELWRGRDNFRGAFAHGLSLKEFPSLGIPIYFGLFLPLVSAAALATGDRFWPSLLAAGIILPGLLVLAKVRKKKAAVSLKIRLVLLSYLYFLVRTLAVLMPRNA